MLGLTQQDRLQDSLAEEGITSLCSVLSLGHSEVCNQHAVVAGESAANILATMLLVPEERFHQAAETWNAAVQHEVGSLTGANMPSSVMRAASEGKEYNQAQFLLPLAAKNSI